MSNTNHYNDRQKFYQNTMLRYYGNGRNGCQVHVYFLLDLRDKQFDRIVDPRKLIAVLTDCDQQYSISKTQGKIQTTGSSFSWSLS